MRITRLFALTAVVLVSLIGLLMSRILYLEWSNYQATQIAVGALHDMGPALDDALAAQEQALRNLQWTLWLGAAIFMTVGLIFIQIRFQLLKPLLSTTRALADLAEGRVETEVHASTRRDEIGDMLRAMTALKASSMERHNLQRALTASNEENARQAAGMTDRVKFFNDLVDAIPVALALRDLDSRYTFVNRTWERYFGASREKVHGTEIGDHFTESETEWSRALDRLALTLGPGATSEPVDSLIKGRRYTQTRTVMTNSEGVVIGVLSASIDTTDKYGAEKALAMERQRLELVVHCTQAGSVEWDAATDHMVYSSRLNQMLGFPPGATQDDWLFLTRVHPQDRQRVQDVFRDHIRSAPGSERIQLMSALQFRMIHADNREIWVASTGAVVAGDSGKTQQYFCSFLDITASITANEAIERGREMAEEASRMKSDFLANMSHEIRTPMNAIIGMSHLALQTRLDARQRNYIEKVDSAARNLLGIVNDILDFSKIEAGKLRFESAPFQLEDVLEHVADLSVMKAQDKGLELLFDIGTDVPTGLVGDSLRLGQVVVNLVNNAIKFTERGEVTVRVRRTATEPGKGDEGGAVRLRFEITDTGMGLTAEQRTRLFGAFSQADTSTTRKYGGTGLGLSISKRLVEMMDGEVGVESEPGVGSTFFFTARIGVQAGQHTLTQNLAVLHPDVVGMRVLVVDDNARAREVMLSMLASLRFKPVAAASGAAAIAELERAQTEGAPYGLVLMDWLMPGMDGLEAIRAIRANAALARTPAFIMVTGYSRDELLERAQDTRIDALLVKPVNPSSLLDSVLTAFAGQADAVVPRKPRRADPREAALALRGAHLLLVEDNQVNRELALEILQSAGIRVDVAHDGVQALARIAETNYDGVLMDCQMPEMDGFEATRRIRQDPRLARLPVLAMTANAMSGDRERCLACGMDDHIPKPLDVAQLFATLQRWIVPANRVDASATAAEAPAPMAAAESPQHMDGVAGLPAIAGLDTALALRRLGGNAGMLRRLAARFSESQADGVRRIRDALASGDRQAAAREAHTLKGLAGNIGATRLASLAAGAEALITQEGSNGVETALDTLGYELQSVISRLDVAIGSAPSSAAAAPARDMKAEAAMAEAMRGFAALLQDNDSTATGQVDDVAGRLDSAGQAAQARQLRRLVSQYDFEGAMEVLRQASESLEIAL